MSTHTIGRPLALAVAILLPIAWLSAAQARASAQGASMAQVMRGHYAEALEVHAAVIEGDLAAAGARARSLADQLEASPRAGSPTALAGAIDAARAVREAPGLLSAAQATATLLAACGRCHRAAGVTPAFPAVTPRDAAGVAGQMHRHQAAAEQLVRGLIVPSDAAWQNGARALTTAPLWVRDLPLDATLRPQMAGTEERLRRLAGDATQVTDPRMRAAFYAQFLAGCADCHKRYAAFRKAPPK